MADNERRRILDMLAAGQISAEEAEELLHALIAEDSVHQNAGPMNADLSDSIKAAVRASLGNIPRHIRASKPFPHNQRIVKQLRIEIEAGDEKKNKNGRVVVTVPLALAKFATNLLPETARDRLFDNGIDLKSLLEELDQDLPEGRLIDIDASDSDSETGRARIIVEVV